MINELFLGNSPVKYAAIVASSNGDNTIVAAQGAGKKIRVLEYIIVAKATTTARFESAAGGTALTGQMTLVANNIVSSGFNPYGLFETAANALLNLETSADGLYGHLAYVVVDAPAQ
jgi:hypothetical protein